MENTQIIILAAGKGTRMKSDVPKAMTKLGDTTMLQKVIATLDSIEYSKPPVVVVGYKKELIMEALGDSVTYAYQNEQKGTGHAVMCAQDALKEQTNRVIILYADMPFVSKETIQQLAEANEDTISPITIATATINNDELFDNHFSGFGRILQVWDC